MNPTSISWCLGPDGTPGYSWNCFAGCSAKPISKGCEHCWACRLAATRLAHKPGYKGLAYVDDSGEGAIPCRWSGEVRFFPEKLTEPLRRRKPTGIFCGDMGDIALLPFEQIAAIFGVMAATPQHRYFILTKRPGRLREWFAWASENTARKIADACAATCQFGEDFDIFVANYIDGWSRPKWDPDQTNPANGTRPRWPLPNVWVGCSVCTQEDADRNIPELLQIPAAVRFLSCEPLLEAVDLREVVMPDGDCLGAGLDNLGGSGTEIDWVIVGGESGPTARPCSVDWVRSIAQQCKYAGVPVFVKQLGANVIADHDDCSTGKSARYDLDWAKGGGLKVRMRDRAGADPAEWPADLRVRQLPEVLR